MSIGTEVDEELIESMKNEPGVRTRDEAIDAAQRLVEKIKGQRAALEALRGIGWEGDYKQMRMNRFPDDWDADPA